MNDSNVESSFNQPQTCERGRSMRIFGKGLLNGLALMLVITPVVTAFAATTVSGIQHSGTPDGDVAITLQASGDDPQVSVFATESPPRIVLDLADTDSQVGTDPVYVGQGAVKQYSTVTAGGRTRLVVDLTRPAAYDYSANAGQVVLSIAAGGAATAHAAGESKSGAYSVTGVDFRRGEEGQARIIVSMDKPGASMSLKESGGGLRLDILNATLPESLSQRLDVTDFATPVQFIDSFGVKSGVRLNLTTKGLYEQLAYESGNDIVVEVKHLAKSAKVAEEEVKFFEDKTYSGTKVTFNFQDIPVRSVLQLIADVSNLNIVVADSVGGNLTLRLTNVPWDQALDIVMDARNLDMRKNGNVIWIGPTAEIAAREQQLLQAQMDRRTLEPLRTVLIPLSYAKAEDMVELIQTAGTVEGEADEYGLLSERGSVTLDERTNTLLVTDTEEKILEIQKLITELDYAVKQVQIESRIVIAKSDFAHELGVRFGVTALHLGSNIGVLAADGRAADTINPAINPRDDGLLDIPSYPGRYQVNLPATDANASTLGLSFLTSDVILDLELSALESEGDGEVISTPRVITANQAEAFIQQGVEIPYENSTSSGATAVQFKEAVLELKVTPLITPDGRIQMDLNVKQDSVGEIFQTARGGSVPSIDTRELETTVLVANGDTVVLGGIFQDQNNSKEEKVPWLGDIPGVGALFRRRANDSSKRELLIFVTPTIVEDKPGS